MQQELGVVGVSLQGLRPLISRADAKAQGLKFYYTGKTCKRGHVVDRYVSGNACSACSKEKSALRYTESPSLWKEKTAKWHKSNPQKVAEKSAKWLRNNKTTRGVTAAIWRGRNLVKLAAKSAVWRKNNPAIHTANGAARRARKRKANPRWALRSEINAFYVAARAASKLTGCPHVVDHVIPLRGKYVSGLHVHNNLQVITAKENAKKHNRYDPMTGI